MKDYIELIDHYKDDMIKDLSNVISIKSIVGEKEGEYPFGKEVHRAFETMLNIGKRDGFKTKNVDNYGGHIEFTGEEESIFALLGHLDIVPEGSGWDTNPYEATIVNNKLIGRGAVDDKGPTIAAYYAMKALKDSGFKPKKTIRLILGLDEETSWEGMEYYMSKEKTPEMGFAPDADFPVIHCEKGLIIFDLFKNFKNYKTDGINLVSLKGGNAPNMVADYAKATIEGADLTETIKKYKEENDADIVCVKTQLGCDIIAKGVSAHGAMPEKGVNAITLIIESLKNVVFANDEINKFIKFYNDKIGFDYHGERFGCNFEDEPSGKLNFNVGVININQDEVKLTINIRYPATMKENQIYDGIESVNEGYNIDRVDHLAPLYVPVDHPLVEVLMDVYREFTGDQKGKPLVIGGATYARTVPNCVAFGPVFPGQDAVEHQPNEFIYIDSMIQSTKMYAEAIYRLCK